MPTAGRDNLCLAGRTPGRVKIRSAFSFESGAMRVIRQRHHRARAAPRAPALLFTLLAAVPAAAADRWYEPASAERGRALYATHCAACHGGRGEGQPDWERRDAMGFYPAPPLDPSGHAWHHPLAQMLQTLETGGGPFGGTMPSFSDVLDEPSRRDVLAWVQSLWPDDVYAQWAAIDAGEATPPAAVQHEH